MTNTRPTEDGWYWYHLPGFEPEIMRVTSGVAYSLDGVSWCVNAMFGKWSERLEPPEEQNAKPVLACSDCGHDNSNSAFAKDEGDICRQFGCFGHMMWMTKKSAQTLMVSKIQ